MLSSQDGPGLVYCKMLQEGVHLSKLSWGLLGWLCCKWGLLVAAHVGRKRDVWQLLSVRIVIVRCSSFMLIRKANSRCCTVLTSALPVRAPLGVSHEALLARRLTLPAPTFALKNRQSN